MVLALTINWQSFVYESKNILYTVSELNLEEEEEENKNNNEEEEEEFVISKRNIFVQDPLKAQQLLTKLNNIIDWLDVSGKNRQLFSHFFCSFMPITLLLIRLSPKKTTSCCCARACWAISLRFKSAKNWWTSCTCWHRCTVKFRLHKN